MTAAPFTAASMFSGIGGAELALPEAQWQWCAEIEPFPSALLAKRFGHDNLSDVLAADFIDRALSYGRLNLLCGGPPCQAFSVAGNRLSMTDPRGNLSLRFVQVAHAIRPRNLLVENVPGWLNTEDNAFGCFLGAIVGADGPLLPSLVPAAGKSTAFWKWRAKGKAWVIREFYDRDEIITVDDPEEYEAGELIQIPVDERHVPTWPDQGMAAGPRARVAWRVRDAQYSGLAQRRRRVFAVVDFGDGADPAAVLFERKSLQGHTPPSREAGQGTSADIAPSLTASGRGVECCGETRGQDPVVAELVQTFDRQSSGEYGEAPVASTISARDYKGASDIVAHTLTARHDSSPDGTGRGTPPVAENHVPAAVAYRTSGNCGAYETGDSVDALTTGTDQSSHLVVLLPSEEEVKDGQANEADATEALRAVREKIGEEAITQWRLGISDPLQSTEVLRSGMHGEGVRGKNEGRNELGHNPLSCSKINAQRAMQSVQEGERQRRAPSRRGSSKQRDPELGTHLPELPHSGASRRTLLHDLRCPAQGAGILRKALPALQEVGQPDGSEDQSERIAWAVRRLTPTEAERLQGYPDGHTLIEFGSRRTVLPDMAEYLRAKGMIVEADNQTGKLRTNAAADGPRYKGLGNAWAVASVRPIARKIYELQMGVKL